MDAHGIRYLTARGPSLCLALHFLDTLVQNCKGGIGLFAIDQKRWREPQSIFARAKYAQAATEGQVHDVIAQIGALFLGFLIVNDLNSDHQPAPANIADDLVLSGPVRGLLENIITDLARVFAVIRFD